MEFFNFEQSWSQKSILASALSGVYLHIVLDSRLYTDIKPFFPSIWNPFFSDRMISSYFEVYGFCVLSGLVGIILFIFKIIKARK